VDAGGDVDVESIKACLLKHCSDHPLDDGWLAALNMASEARTIKE
jgi:hypothetical protein